MTRKEWLHIDHTQTYLGLLKEALNLQKEFMTHRHRIAETADATAMAFCYSSGFTTALHQTIEKLENVDDWGNTSDSKEKDLEVVSEEYPNA